VEKCKKTFKGKGPRFTTTTNMGALANFTFSGDDNSKSVTMETTMTVADFSGKGLGVSGAIMLSAFLPKCT
jgi:hypothetical protein